MKTIFKAIFGLVILAACTLQLYSFSSPEPTTTVKYPFGAADKFTPSYSNDTLTVTVTNSVTYYKPATLTGNLTILASVGSEVTLGALLYVEVVGSDDRTVTYSTGFTANAITIDSVKTYVQQFFYDGTKFNPVAAAIKIN